MQKSTPKLPPRGERSEPARSAPDQGVEGRHWRTEGVKHEDFIKEWKHPIKTPKAG